MCLHDRLAHASIAPRWQVSPISFEASDFEVGRGTAVMDTAPASRLRARLVARAWADDDFKRRLLADPQGTLAEEGIDIPEGVQLSVQESTADRPILVIPPRPADLLSETDLGAVFG